MWPAAVYLFVYLIKSPCTCLKQPLDMDKWLLKTGAWALNSGGLITGSTVH